MLSPVVVQIELLFPFTLGQNREPWQSFNSLSISECILISPYNPSKQALMDLLIEVLLYLGSK